MTIVVLTGGIASGKSTVTRFFKELGAYIIDWDVLAREVVKPHLEVWKGIVEYFGAEILNEDLTLNRKKLAEIVFGDEEKVKKLDHITHPEIIKEDERITNEIGSSDPDALIIKDIPLLGEEKSPLARAVFRIDKTVVVYASEENQIERLKEKGFKLDEARKRISSQMPLREKIKLADFVIYNDGSLEETKRQVEEIFAKLKGGVEHGGERQMGKLSQTS